jgi:hypothetical protein
MIAIPFNRATGVYSSDRVPFLIYQQVDPRNTRRVKTVPPKMTRSISQESMFIHQLRVLSTISTFKAEQPRPTCERLRYCGVSSEQSDFVIYQQFYRIAPENEIELGSCHL